MHFFDVAEVANTLNFEYIYIYILVAWLLFWPINPRSFHAWSVSVVNVSHIN